MRGRNMQTSGQKGKGASGQSNWPALRKRLFDMVSVGVINDPLNKGYDIVSTVILIINLVVSVMLTFDELSVPYGGILLTIEKITVAFFAVDYVLRFITAKLLYTEYSEPKAILRYVFSMAGIVDLLSFLPYYLPVFFPSGAVAFRMFRVARIFRLFRINAYYDSLNVITEVIYSKKQQLLSSVFIISILMLASSLCMYSLEHEAQPEVFKNAFSGIWWSTSTLLTVGYGDIYPVTTMGKFFSIIITFLGVGMVAIPTGIISAGFVEQYSRFKKIGDYAIEEDLHFIKVEMNKADPWTGKRVMDLGLPKGMIIAVIQRGKDTLVPRGDVELRSGDRLIIGAESLKNDRPIKLKEVTIRRQHPWNGTALRDLDISRQTFIVAVQRKGRTVVPKGDFVLRENDTILLYSQKSREIDEVESTSY